MKVSLGVVFGAVVVILLLIEFSNAQYYGNPDSVRLSEVKALTLKRGQMTRGRRVAPVPQLQCVGGSAQGEFEPEVVQCINVGSNGIDVQWECKTDMSNKYRFGEIVVSCEGYSQPSDEYVLAGSCGLEYKLEYTEEGRQSMGGHQHNNYFGSNRSSSFNFGTLIMYAIVAFVLYSLLRSCYQNGNAPHHGGNPGGAYYSGGGGGGGGGGGPFGGGNFAPGCAPSQPSSGFGGFWSGLAVGGILGHLFNRPHNYGYGGNMPGYSGQGGFGFGGGRSFGSRSSSFGGGGTRTASGFGGTRRR